MIIYDTDLKGQNISLTYALSCINFDLYLPICRRYVCMHSRRTTIILSLPNSCFNVGERIQDCEMTLTLGHKNGHK